MTISESGGWIKLHRSFLDHPIWRDVPPAWSRVALAILLMANHQCRKWYDGHDEIEIPAGSFVTSAEKFGVVAGVSRQQFRDATQLLEKTHFITSKRTNRYTIITVTNWAAYQGDDAKENQRSNHQGTSREPAENQPRTTNKKDKKERREEITPQPPKGQDELSILICSIAEGIHERHPRRDRIVAAPAIVTRLRTIAKSYPAKERKAKLLDLDESHREWSDSEQWAKGGGEFCKGVEAWLNPSKRLWEQRPAAPKPETRQTLTPFQEMMRTI